MYSAEKKPRIEKHIISYDSVEPVWKIGTLDTDGPWGWKQINIETIWKDIYAKLANFETMTWAVIKQSGSHLVAKSDIDSKAQRRLKKINQQDDIDELFSLRLTGKKRIWGIMDQNTLKILWWDPNHTVCQAQKKHT